MTSGSSIKLDVVGELGLFSSEIRIISSLSSLDLDTEDLGGELQDFVLDLAVLFDSLVYSFDEIAGGKCT